MTGECSRCGACCTVIGIGKTGMDKDTLEWMRARGLKEEQGFFIIPHQCQYLTTYHGQFACIIHDTKPKSCQKFHGQKHRAGKKYYVPPGCTMKGNKKGDE